MLNLFLDIKVQSVYSAFMTEKKCQKKCKLDQDTLICLGCGRTLMEIVSAGNAAAKEQSEATRASSRKNGKKSKAA